MQLAFCGLGLMGAAMARRLLQAGHGLTVWNRSPAKAVALTALGARVAATPAQAAEGADGVLMCLYDAASVEAVVFGPEGLAQAHGLKWVVDHTTIPPEAARSMAARLKAACGADWLDAPVSGGVGGVEAGTLAVMVGGEATHLDEARHAMAAYAANITAMGPSGAGQAAKLCNQTIVATTVLAIAEAVALAQRNGIEASRLTQALAGGWADSRPLQVFVPRMLQPQPHIVGALSTMTKDVDAVMAAATASGTPMPLMAQVQQALRQAEALGLGAAELSAVVSLLLPHLREGFARQAAGETG